MTKEKSQIYVSISIVNYNTLSKTKDLIDTIYNNTDSISFEILLVDNASDENIIKIKNEFPDVKLIQNQENIYFTKADNQNLSRALGKYILSINSDTLVVSGAIQTMINFLRDHPDVGAVTPKIIYPDGGIQPSIGRFITLAFGFYEVLGLNRFFPNNKAYTYVMSDKLPYNPDYPHEAEVLYGACIMIRREVLETVGLKDEKLVHGWDEYDWCKRMMQYGWKLFYIPSAVIIHDRGASREKIVTNSDSYIQLENHSWKGFFYLYKKFFGIHVFLLLKFLWYLNKLITHIIDFAVYSKNKIRQNFKR